MLWFDFLWAGCNRGSCCGSLHALRLQQISQSQFDPHLCFPSAAAAAATSASLLLPGLHLHLLLEELAIARHRRPRGLHLGARLQPPCLSLRRHAASPSLPQGVCLPPLSLCISLSLTAKRFPEFWDSVPICIPICWIHPPLWVVMRRFL